LQRVVRPAPDPSPLLRPGLLDGLRVMVAGGGVESPFGAAVAARCEGLGGRVERLEVDPFGDEPPAPEGEVDVLVWDGAAAFAAFEGVAAVRAALDGAWLAIRPVARAATSGDVGGGKLLLLAPLPGDAHAEAARAGLENLARTLSVEWARFGVRVVALHPGTRTEAADVAELAAFLASRAGDYYSGCLFSLGEAGG
jgi:NAD(P)-dependent dehydrogenase (short-subunit alcohol dehydrogenase family)